MDTSEVIDDIIDDVLEHHGVMGMKWGIRRAEKKFVSRATKPKKNLSLKIQLHNATGTAMNNVHIPRINNKPEYIKASNEGRLRNDSDPITQQYHAEYMKAYEGELNKEAAKLGTSPSGQQYYAHLNNDFLGFSVGLRDSKVHHADSESFKVEFVKDEQGRIIGFKLVEDSLTQSETFVEEYLEHHGIKGMKWGIRRDRPSGPQGVTVRPSKFPGSKRLVTKGGGGHATVSEASSSRTIGQIGKKSGTKALTNAQLEEYNKRLNLEQNFSRLHYSDKNPGQKFVATLMGHGSRQLTDAGNQVASHQVKKRLEKRGLIAISKKAAKTAAVAAAV